MTAVPAENSKQQPLPRRKLRPERPGMITSVIGRTMMWEKKVMISFATMVMMTTRLMAQEERSGTLAN